MILITIVLSPNLSPEWKLIYLMLAGYFPPDTAHRYLSTSMAEYMQLEKCRADDRALSRLWSSCVQCAVCTAVYSSSPAHLCRLNPLYDPENRCYSLSVQFSCSVVSDSLQLHGLQHVRLPCHQHPELAQTHVHRVGDAIQPSQPLSSLLLPPSIFPSVRVFSSESVLHTSGSQSIGVSASAWVLPVNIWDWFASW